MKFLFEKFNVPMTTGRYGSGDIAAIGIIIFPYLFVRLVNLFVDFFVVRISTASNMYFFPMANPMVDPRAEPSTVAMIAKYIFIPASSPAASATIGEIIWGIRSRKIDIAKSAGAP